MTLDSGAGRIVRLAWCRQLGLPDDALEPPDRRLQVVDDTAQDATFVQLFGRTVLAGPGWFVAATSRLDEEVLALESALLRFSAGGRSLGESALYYAEEVPPLEPSDAVVVSLEARHAREVEAACPADEVIGVGLSGMSSTVTLLRDGEEPGPALATAAWTVRGGIIADLRVLVRPDMRRLGLGTYVAAVAAEEAFADGLVLQLRVPQEATGARAVAQRLGLEPVGSVTSVRLGRH